MNSSTLNYTQTISILARILLNKIQLIEKWFNEVEICINMYIITQIFMTNTHF